MSKKITTIMILAVCACAYSFAEDLSPTRESQHSEKVQCVCKNPDGENCKTAQKKYKAKRDLLPRHLHSSIKRPQKCNCDCHK